MTEHIKPEQSMLLMALSSNDAERRASEGHAEQCSACRAALDEAQLMLGWLNSSEELPLVSAALKARVLKATLVEAPAKASALSPWLLAAGLLVSFLLALFTSTPGDLSPATGATCMAYEGIVAIAPFTVSAWLGVRGVIRLAPLNLAVASMGGALAGQLILLSRCESQALSHVLTFHVVGVALASALGYAATLGLVRLRAR